MQMLDFIAVLSSNLSTSFAAEVNSITALQLPFSPIKLICLILWVNLCLYLVQRIELSPLVPKRYKLPANVATLLTGPIFLLLLIIINIVKESSASTAGVFEILKQQLSNALTHLRPAGRVHQHNDSCIKLLDSSGKSIDQIYGHGDSRRPDIRILALTEQIIADALDQRASDILIDPKDQSSHTIRLRIDGVLRIVKELNDETSKAVINSVKAVSSMDISEKRRPQDGAFTAQKGKTTASFRVASAGVLYGEKLAIRILNQNAGTFTFADLGLTEKQSSLIESAINKPSGMVLICGPTGSGKTTTMYAILNQIDRRTRNVITVEDPVEAALPQASQIEINPKADITFPKALRSILRQNPDVICVGEIRDEESAEIALRASQTGHLVLATLHCDSNTTAIVRLLDLGVSPLLLSSGLSLLVSQRLLRRLCEHCSRPAKLTDGLIDEFNKKGIDYGNMFEAVGCKHCAETGYFGRVAIMDILPLTDELKGDIINKKGLLQVEKSESKTESSRRDRFNMRKEGLRKVAAGITSLEELKRVVG